MDDFRRLSITCIVVIHIPVLCLIESMLGLLHPFRKATLLFALALSTREGAGFSALGPGCLDNTSSNGAKLLEVCSSLLYAYVSAPMYTSQLLGWSAMTFAALRGSSSCIVIIGRLFAVGTYS